MPHRRMPARVAAGVFALLLAAVTARCTGERDRDVAAASGGTDAGAAADRWCATLALPDQLCPFIPHDVNDTLPIGYAELSDSTQRPFDVFSWQSFVALNWPADGQGQPLPVSGPGDSLGAPRVWESYAEPADVFGGGEPEGCNFTSGRRVLRLMAKNAHGMSGGSILESTGQPLIDRNLNFALYEIRMNPDWVTYVDTAGLRTAQGQQGKEVNFPVGSYANLDSLTGGSVGAIEMKMVWRILQTEKGDDPSQFYSQTASIYVPAQNSQTGSALCIDSVTVGLVGMHIVHKTTSQPGWVWSTFEHKELAPTCASGAGTCGNANTRYSFFNPSCPSSTCPWNTPPSLAQGDSTFLWAASPPYAANYAIGGSGTQAVRTQTVFLETDSVTAEWQQKLQGTVWANYRLIGSQWVNPEVPGAYGIPEILGNSALETYIPDSSSCTRCHVQAVDAGGERADFSFLLGLAGNGDEEAYFRAVRAAAPPPQPAPRRDTSRTGAAAPDTGKQR